MLASAGMADRLAADTQALQALKSRAAANDPDALRAAARQFEAMLLQTLMKEMRESSWHAAGDGFAPSESLKLYRELLDQQWVQRIVQGRGLGFAERLTEQMLKAQAVTESSTDVPHPPATRLQPRTGIGQADLKAADATIGAPRTAASENATSPGATAPGTRKARFLQTMRPHAEAAARTTGLPAEFILAHAALESGWGVREIRDRDGRPSHNLFGIKAGSGWTGPSVETETTEYRHGLPLRLSERFRAYDDYRQAFADYANLLVNRYGSAVRAGTDADTFAQALAAGGYATDPAYASKLRGVITSVTRMNA